MIASRDSLAVKSPETPPDGATSDMQDLYQGVLTQVMGSLETLVAQAFAAHASRHGLPLPTAIKSALDLARSDPDAKAPGPLPSTGNAGLDFLNEQLQKNAPGLVAQSAVPTPPWLQPFTLPEKVRFTRTPDPVMRWERAAPTHEELAAAARVAAEEAARSAIQDLQREAEPRADSDVPVWRKPFTLPPNVRYTRTPDPKLAREDDPSRPDGVSRTRTVTQTVTTVETVTFPAQDGDGPRSEQVMIETAALPSPTPCKEPAAATPAVPSPPPIDLFSLSTTISHRPSLELGIPIWLAAPVAATPLASPTVAPLAEPESPKGNETDDRIDKLLSEASADELSQLFEEPTELEVADDEDWADEPEVATALVTAPERRAFASHGIPGFENAVHFNGDAEGYEYPPCDLLAPAQKQNGLAMTRETLEQNARLLEGVLEDFGVRGEIIAVRPGPVVTLYEFEPAPGVKSSRVMNLADDIARSMSAVSARVAVVQGRNVIGIELPNERRETVFLRELIDSSEFADSNHRLAIALGKTIGGESVIVDLARMPHLLVAGTTGSGKSVAINTMILSLLYRLRPEECRLIMVDPKMLELSIYDGIPHLLTPVVTDSKKAVIALKWAVREMEDRYKKMAKVGVRNIDGFNARVTEAKEKGEVITRTVQHGFDRETGEPMFETEEMDLATLPYIVIIVDEMADLMMVAGKEIEGAIQRLAQMARAAGLHLIMATQRPSVDVITGTIKANFPTRISFQVTSKIDSRTILGEQGAEQLLGAGDMLHMAGGGRIVRVHGPFVSDGEVEKVVWHLKAQGRPEYLDIVTSDGEDVGSVGPAPAPADDEDGDGAVFDRGNFGEETGDLYEQGVKIVLRDKKCSTSYIQRRLQVGYNKAASIVERMEKEGLVGPANPTGKREILNFSRDHSRVIFMPRDGD